jgi:phosphotransferase system enzyme I (PtsI)
LRMITDAASGAGIPVSVCGEMAGEPLHAPIMVALGISQLSMNAGSIPRVKRLIRELRRDDCVQLFDDAFTCETHQQVSALVRSFVRAKTSIAASFLQGDEK